MVIAINIEVIPIKTHVITKKDNIIEVIKKYAGPLMSKGDIITIAETVLAISQGRYMRPDEVHPSLAARTISRFINQDGSLSSPYALQVVMNEEGKVRVVSAFVIGSLCQKLFGMQGVFYRLAGAQASLVDDITGTMPPFDKFIILGPRQPKKIVQEIKKRLGVDVAIIDANDLGRTKIVAFTGGIDKKLLEAVFRKNPAGNADQQTPIVLIKRK